MLVQGVRALRRQSPQPRAHIFAAGALQIIRVRDFHQIRRPPVQVFRLDEVITLNRFHDPANWTLEREATLANFSADRRSTCCEPSDTKKKAQGGLIRYSRSCLETELRVQR